MQYTWSSASRSDGKMYRPPTACTVSGWAFLPSLRRALTKIPAASSWWLPSSAIKPPPVRLHSRQRQSSAIDGNLRAVTEREVSVVEVLGVDVAVAVPGFPLRQLVLDTTRRVSDHVRRPAAFLSSLSFLAIGSRTSFRRHVDRDFAAGQRLRPTVTAGQVAAMPLRLDVCNWPSTPQRIRFTALS